MVSPALAALLLACLMQIKEGQGWFSASTRDALDAVSSFDSSLSEASARDPDPYNMHGFSQHYAWLNGG